MKYLLAADADRKLNFPLKNVSGVNFSKILKQK